MTDMAKKIADLIEDSNKNASFYTHNISELGDGSMHRGLSRIVEYCNKEIEMAQARGLQKGLLRGGIGGVAGTVVIGGIVYIVCKKVKSIHEEERRKNLQTSENANSQKGSTQEDINEENLDDV